MAATTGDISPSSGPGLGTWRTPLVIIICGCLIALLSFGPRSSLGFFIQPMGREFAWGRDVFGLALALQNLLWGLGQPIAGAIADRFGILRVMIVGALLYAGGLLLMRYSTTPLSLDLGAGVLIGFGLSGCSFNLVLSAFSKLLPVEKRGLALGAGTAAGSFGQFLFAPFGVPPCVANCGSVLRSGSTPGSPPRCRRRQTRSSGAWRQPDSVCSGAARTRSRLRCCLPVPTRWAPLTGPTT